MSTFTNAMSANYLVNLEDGYSFDTPIVTDAVLLEYPRCICAVFHVEAGSSPTGVFDLEGSLDGINFFSLSTLAGTSAKSFSTNGTYALNFRDLAVRWVRANVTHTSGDGEVSIILSVF